MRTANGADAARSTPRFNSTIAVVAPMSSGAGGFGRCRCASAADRIGATAAAVTGDRVAAPRSARDDCDGGGVQLLAHAAADIAQHDELVVRCLTGAQNQ